MTSRRTIPTVDIFLEAANPTAQGWTWVMHPAGASAEMAYTRDELCKLLCTYGRWGSIMTGGSHIRITARGRFSGRWLAEWQWAGYHPMTEAWVHWPAWENLCFQAQLQIPYYTEHDDRRLIETGATDVSTLRLARVKDEPIPDTVPHVRDKEDVPHEGALADLYGLRHARGDRFVS